MTKNNFFNIAEHLVETAKKYPLMKAIIFPYKKDSSGRRSYTSISFKDLNIECDRYAHGLAKIGVKKNMKVLLMVNPSIEFIALTWALFKIGSVPILIDPGMGRKRLLECIKRVSADVFIGIKEAHFARILFPKYFRSIKYNILINSNLPFLGYNLEKMSTERSFFRIADTKKTSQAAILFTSGSTGPAKGVVYEHGMFDAQIQALLKAYRFEKFELDLACFPLFALFDAALCMTSVIPDMDPSKPALVDPKNIVEAIKDNNITTTFGSPAIWKRVIKYCEDNNITFPTMKRILIAGAPVSPELIKRFQKILPNGDINTPYGATESLPISSITGKEVLTDIAEKSYNGFGICVGKPLETVIIKIIKITDNIIEKWNDNLVVKQGEVGEIAVKGNVVTKKYYKRNKNTKYAKIYNENNKVWHRIGDVGYFDIKGRLWFCGRKAHRVETQNGIMFTIPCEAIFNHHKKVFRSALVGIGGKGKQDPVIIIEPEKDHFPETEEYKNKFKNELLKISSEYEHTKNIKKILFYKSFPVDIRHNAKINREQLAEFAESKLK